MICTFDLDSLDMIRFNGDIHMTETDKKALIESKINDFLSNYNELVPAIEELYDVLSISKLTNTINLNRNEMIKNKDARNLYKLNEFSVFKEKFDELVNAAEMDHPVKNYHIIEILYKNSVLAHKYGDLFYSEEDIKSYFDLLLHFSRKNWYELKERWMISVEDSIRFLTVLMIHAHITTELFYVFSTLNNNTRPVTSTEGYIKKRKYNSINYDHMFSLEAKDDDDDWDEDEKPKKKGLFGKKKDKEEDAGDDELDDGEEGTNVVAKIKQIGLKTKKFFGKVGAAIASIPMKLTQLQKKIRLWNTDRKHLKFYRRHIGRIEGLWKNFADSVEIEENKMRDDPVVLLRDKTSKYIVHLGKRMCELADEVEKLAADISQANFDGKIELAKKWGQDAPDRDKNGKEIPEDKIGQRVFLATKRKMARIILEGEFKVYGFTEESMTNGPLPPPNHLMVSTIVADPFAHPEKQSIKDIFNSHESFYILASSDKNKLLATTELSNAVLRNKINAQTFKKIEEDRKALLQGFKNMGQLDKKEKKRRKKMIKSISSGIAQSVKAMAKTKIYLMDCINVYFSIVLRVDDLAYRALEGMIQAEAQGIDKRYSRTMGAGTDKNNLEKGLSLAGGAADVGTSAAAKARDFAMNRLTRRN